MGQIQRHLIQFGKTPRRTLRLSKYLTKESVGCIKEHVLCLYHSQLHGQHLPPDTVTWLAVIGDEFYDKLVNVGLVQPRNTGSQWATYFAYDRGNKRIKIGRTRRDAHSYVSNQTWLPDAQLLGFTYESEAELHTRFNEFRIWPNREWFRDAPSIRDYISRHCTHLV